MSYTDESERPPSFRLESPMTTASEIHGHCDDRFSAVREAFGKNFEQGLELGASFSAVIDGEPVIDIWAGDRDEQGNPWERDTIVNVYSTTKAMAALSTLMLVDRGELDLDAPVASVWPEFAAAGKEAIPVRQLLSHTSGLAGWEQPITLEQLYDWSYSTGLLAAQAPLWEPGTASGYHALTHGHLLGEVVRRVSGRSLGTFYREEVAQPLDVDFHIGLPEEHESRVGRLVAPPEASLAAAGGGLNEVAAKVLGNPPLRGDDANSRAWRAAEIPAANGTGNARAVARVAGVLANGGSADGVRLLGPETLAKLIEEQSHGPDLVLGLPIRFGLGFGLTSKDLPIGPNPRTFFWGGWGGSLVIVDPDARLGLSYVMNKMGSGTMGDVRAFNILAALYPSLA
jgi:CubicO group peptidase (beta-lactamase class C family)